MIKSSLIITSNSQTEHFKKKSMELKAIKMEFIGNIVLLIRVPVN